MSLVSSCSLFLMRERGAPARLDFRLAEKKRVIYDGRIVGPVRRQGSRLYWVTDKKKLYCFDVQNENPIWTYEGKAAFDSPPVIGRESVFLLDQEGYVHAVDGLGQLLWKIGLENVTPLSLSLALNLLLVGTEGEGILAVDPVSGRQLWRVRAEGSFQAGAVSWGNSIICSSQEGQISILSPQGRVLKTLAMENPISNTPLVDEGRLYVGTADGYFHCLDLKRGNRKWRVDVRGKILAPPRADEKRVFLSAANCVLYCLNKRNGHLLWWRALPSRSYHEPEFTDGQILISSSSSTILCLDRKTGEEVGTFEGSSEVRSNLIWLEGFLLLHLYDPQREKGSLVFLEGKEKAHSSLARGSEE